MLRFLRQAFANKRDAAFAFNPQVTVRAHGQGVVFLHNAKGVVYSCNRVGAQVWAGLREGLALAAIAEGIAQEYGVSLETVTRDADRFLADLESLETSKAARNGAPS